MFLLPMYFVIGQMTAGWPHFSPSSRSITRCRCRPRWMLVYGSLYMCGFLLPLRRGARPRAVPPVAEGVPFVMVVSYVGFLLYPTIAPRDENVAGLDGFAAWSLQLFYDLDQPYGCFPSLHVAYSFVGRWRATACTAVSVWRPAAWAAIDRRVHRLHQAAFRRRCHRRRDRRCHCLRDLPARTPARSRARASTGSWRRDGPCYAVAAYVGAIVGVLDGLPARTRPG